MVEYCFVLTGCTGGLGLALLERLVGTYPGSHFITICRNEAKALNKFEKITEILKKGDGRLDSK